MLKKIPSSRGEKKPDLCGHFENPCRLKNGEKKPPTSEKERVTGAGRKKNASTDRDRRQLRGVAARNTWHAYVPARGARRIFLCF